MKNKLFRHFASWVGAVLLALAGAAPAARAQAVHWARAVGQSATGWNISQIVADAQGNTYICGQFSDSLVIGSFTLYAPDSLQGSASDAFVAKLDPNGICLWATRAGGQGLSGGGNNLGYDSAYGLALDAAGDVFVTGSFDSYSIGFGPYTLYNAGIYGDLFVAKLDGATGQWVWAQRAGGGQADGGIKVVCDVVGDAYILGAFYSGICQIGTTALSRRTTRDLLVAKVRGNTGQWQWATRAALGAGWPADLTSDDRGHLFVVGGFLHPAADFGTHTLSAYSAGSGTTYVANPQCFVARLSTSTGAWQWATQGGDSNQQYGGARATAIAVDRQGRITVAGEIDGCYNVRFGGTTVVNNSGIEPIGGRLKSDAFVAQLDSTGQWLSASTVGGAGYERVNALVPEASGGFCLVGTFDSPSLPIGASRLTSTTVSGYLARTDSTGTWLDASSVGSGANTYVTGLAEDGIGRRYISGIFRAPTLQLGSTTLYNGSPNGYTGFVARLGAGPLAVSTEQPATLASLAVWPNPTTGTVRVSGPAPGQPIWLVDMQGRCVARGWMPSAGSLVLELPAGLAAGLYVVRVPGTRLARRLVVE